jgi:hypothetical protein
MKNEIEWETFSIWSAENTIFRVRVFEPRRLGREIFLIFFSFLPAAGAAQPLLVAFLSKSLPPIV